MQRSVIVAFDGRGLVLGNATARMPGMDVRVLIHGVQDGRLRTTLELHAAGSAGPAIVHGLATRYDTQIVPLSNDGGTWKGQVLYNRPDQLRGHAAYDALLEFVPRLIGGVLFFSAGVGILRLDPRGTIGVADVEAALAAWAPGLHCCVEEHQELRPLEDWHPGPECAGLRQRLVTTAA